MNQALVLGNEWQPFLFTLFDVITIGGYSPCTVPCYGGKCPPTVETLRVPVQLHVNKFIFTHINMSSLHTTSCQLFQPRWFPKLEKAS